MSIVEKKSKVAVIIILITAALLSIISNANLSKSIHSFQDNLENEILKCSNVNENDNMGYDEYCSRVIANKNINVDTLTSFSNILIFQLKFLNPIAILLVLIPSLIEPIYILKNKYIINCNNRMEYKEFLKIYFKRAYKYVWILPLIGIIIYLPTLFYSSLSPQYQLINDFTYWETSLIEHPLVFMLMYCLNLLIYSFIFINMGLICIRKKPKYILSLILTYIIYVLIQLFFELVINNYIIISIFHSEVGYLFNIMNMFIFSDQFGLFNLFLFSVFILIISFICLYYSYRNKEKLIVEAEKI